MALKAVGAPVSDPLSLIHGAGANLHARPRAGPRGCRRVKTHYPDPRGAMTVLRLNTEGRSKRGSQGRGRPRESQGPCLQVSTRRAWTVTAAGMGRASCALHLHPGCREDSLR
ncbi:hypothetical protein H8959_012406 [Pygathrix nigripes]